MAKKQVYVVVRHHSGRCFSLDRHYHPINDDFTLPVVPVVPTENTWIGWMPEHASRPRWAADLPDDQFIAYWYDPELKQTPPEAAEAA